MFGKSRSKNSTSIWKLQVLKNAVPKKVSFNIFEMGSLQPKNHHLIFMKCDSFQPKLLSGAGYETYIYIFFKIWREKNFYYYYKAKLNNVNSKFVFYKLLHISSSNNAFLTLLYFFAPRMYLKFLDYLPHLWMVFWGV